MYLYELALQLDERSADLSERARALGLDGASPNTDLTAPQVAALRAGVAIPPPASKRPAPVSTDEPSGDGPAPLSWTATAAAALSAAATADAADPALADAPAPARLPAPGGRRSSLAPPPKAPSDGSDGPVVKRPSRLNVKNLAMAALAVAVLVGLFAVLSSGRTDPEQRRRELDARNARLDEEADADADAVAEEQAARREADFAEAVAANRARAQKALAIGVTDADRFCEGATEIHALESRISTAVRRRDWSSLGPSMAEARPGWTQAVDGAAGATTGALRADVDAYRGAYTSMFDRIGGATTVEQVRAAFPKPLLDSVAAPASRINAAIRATCAT